MGPGWDGTERRHSADPERCEEHSVTIAVLQSRIDRMDDDLANYRQWRGEVSNKLDIIHGRITTGQEKLNSKLAGLWVKVGALNAGALALAWAYAQWGPK